MSDPKSQSLDAPLACARLIASTDALLKQADRLRRDRDELLRVIRGDADDHVGDRASQR